MQTSDRSSVDAWDETDIEMLLALDRIDPLRFRSRYGDGNLNGRSYGGQLLGQALMAAAQTVPDGRPAAAYQFTFLRGSDPNRPIEFAVTILQEGGRFSSRHVLGVQGDKEIVLSANATFALPLAGPGHQAAVGIDSDPDTLEGLRMIPDAIMAELRPLGPYSRHIKPSMDFRIPDIDRQLRAATAQSRLQFWLRTQRAFSRDARTEAAVFAYLSDWWLNFSSFGVHLRDLQSQPPLYISSLNHCIWFHRPFSPADWMHVETESPCATSGRGLSMATIRDRMGLTLATTCQESLMVRTTSA